MTKPDSTTWGTTPLQRQQQAEAIQALRNTASNDITIHGYDDPDNPTINERLNTVELHLDQIDRNLNSLLQGLKTITNILNP